MTVIVEHLRVEYLDDAFGVGTPRPRLSWRVAADRTWTQCAAEIELTTDARTAVHHHDGDTSVFVDWPFPALRSRQRATLRVRVRAVGQEWSDWSRPLDVEAALLEPGDWSAAPITRPSVDDEADATCALYFRRDFELMATPTRARLYATSLGIHVCEINGHRVGDALLEPGWSNYRHRIRYRTHDVTAVLRGGANAIGFIVAEGWYRGRLGFGGGQRAIYGDEIGPLAQLEIAMTDGSETVIVTDAAWTTGRGAIRSTGLYDGEHVDLGCDDQTWSQPGHDTSSWSPVRVLPPCNERLDPASGPPVRPIESLAPIAMSTTPTGETIVDFGQNLVGRVRLQAASAGSNSVQLRHAEVLEHGELCVRPLREALQTDTFEWQAGKPSIAPTFSLHGFRYLEITGGDVDQLAADITAEVCHSDMEPIGTFHCSHAELERLHENARWSMRGNFVDLPTDCPQRDERMGWTGDIQIFAPAAAFLYDCNGFLASWLHDLAIEQRSVGTVPAYVPWFETIFPAEPSAAWGDAAVIVPWTLYERFGDVAILRRQYTSMCNWVDQVSGLTGDSHLWSEGLQFGDWVDPTAPANRPAAGRTEPSLVATAYHGRSARLLAAAADALGEERDAQRYRELADAVADAFRNEYVTPSGRLANDSPTAYSLAIQFDMITDPEQRRRAGDRLAELVHQDDHHIGTGFVGTPLVCDALTATGHLDSAYHLLLQDTCPSWLYPVTMGATTIWERWDSLLPDGTVNPGWMTSFNHYALGAVVDYLHRVVAGLAPGTPGYRHLDIHPRPGGGLTEAGATLRTPYGHASAAWARRDGRFELNAVVPANCTATITLPDDTVHDVGSGRHRLTSNCRAASEDPARPPRLAVGPELPD